MTTWRRFVIIYAMKRETLDWLNCLLLKAALLVGAICPFASIFRMERVLDFLLPIFLVLIGGCTTVGFVFTAKND